MSSRVNPSRVSVFNSPLLLGFDQFERTLERISKSADGYPPYNIERLDENRFRITIAVAGFSMDDLAVELEGNQLTVRGRQDEAEDERIFLHRGIAARQFQRSFVLAEGIEVTAAQLDNGLLNIELTRPEPESRVQKISIENRNGAPRAVQTDQGKE